MHGLADYLEMFLNFNEVVLSGFACDLSKGDKLPDRFISESQQQLDLQLDPFPPAPVVS